MESLRGTEVVYWQNFLKNAAQDLDNYYDWAHPDFGVLLRVSTAYNFVHQLTPFFRTGRIYWRHSDAVAGS